VDRPSWLSLNARCATRSDRTFQRGVSRVQLPLIIYKMRIKAKPEYSPLGDQFCQCSKSERMKAKPESSAQTVGWGPNSYYNSQTGDLR